MALTLPALYSIMMSPWTVFFCALLFIVYKWSISTYKFFDGRGILYRKPAPFFGNTGTIMLRTKTLHDTILDIYNQFKHKRYYGIFQVRRPILVVRDPKLIKQMTVKDFEHFLDHRDLILDEDSEPLLGKSLFMLKGQKWRDMRSTLSPAFTGSKMKQMFQLIVQCAEEATDIIKKESVESTDSHVQEMKDVFTRCATDVIASAAFGIQVNSLKDRDNEFYTVGQRSTSFGIKDILTAAFMYYFPKLSKFLGIQFFDAEQSEFYRSLVHDAMKLREKLGYSRPDMIQLLMEARKGSLRHDNEGDDTEGFATVKEVFNDQLKGQTRIWSDEDLTAQCFLFFLAGFETTSTLMCVTAHELAENLGVQEKLVKEIDETRIQLNGQPITYDILQKMKYMDMVISESLRKWPPIVSADRICTKPYEFTDDDGHKIKINKGESVMIPVLGLHRDSEYYPNPDKFDPERFNDENKYNIVPFTYLPFGAGPRNCIGSRFALMEVKAFFFYMLSSFTFEVTEKTQIPLKLVQTGFSIKAEKGYNLHIKLRL